MHANVGTIAYLKKNLGLEPNLKYIFNYIPKKQTFEHYRIFFKIFSRSIFDNKNLNDNIDCPGTESQSAGKVSACSGCPNQKICSSGAAKQVDDGSVERIRNRLRSIKYKIMVMSGKGGVGKSTVTSLLARMLAELNFKVLILFVCKVISIINCMCLI